MTKTMFDYFKEAVLEINPAAKVELVKEFGAKYKISVMTAEGENAIMEIPKTVVPGAHKKYARDAALLAFSQIQLESGNKDAAWALFDQIQIGRR